MAKSLWHVLSKVVPVRLTHPPDERPALLLVGDARGRSTIMSMAASMCNKSLAVNKDSTPGVGSHLGGASVKIASELDGEYAWQSGGGFVCSADSPLLALGWYLSYGVSMSPPYPVGRRDGTSRTRFKPLHQPGDITSPTIRSHEHALAAIESFVIAREPSPTVVVVSSFLHDLIRLWLADKRFDALKTRAFLSSNPIGSFRNPRPDRTSGKPLALQVGAEAARALPWLRGFLSGYEANLTAFADSVVRLLRRRSPRNALVLQSDYPATGPQADFTRFLVPFAAIAVKAAAARLSLPVVDVSAMDNFKGKPPLISPLSARADSYQSFLHSEPTELGACFVWNAISQKDRRVPPDSGPGSSCLAKWKKAMAKSAPG